MRLDAELSAAMDRVMVKRTEGGVNQDPPVSERTLPRVSTITSGCARQAYYYQTGAPKLPMDPLSANSAEIGILVEDSIIADAEAVLSEHYGEPVKFERQVRVTTDCYTGSADAWEPKRKIILDAKSGGVNKADIAKKKGTPGENYEVQTNLYGEPLGAKLVMIPFRAVGKSKADGPGVHQFYLADPNPELVASARAVALASMEAVKAGSPPPRAYDRKHWLCAGYCSYRDTCWKGGA